MRTTITVWPSRRDVQGIRVSREWAVTRPVGGGPGLMVTHVQTGTCLSMPLPALGALRLARRVSAIPMPELDGSWLAEWWSCPRPHWGPTWWEVMMEKALWYPAWAAAVQPLVEEEVARA